MHVMAGSFYLKEDVKRFGTLMRYIFDDSITPYSRVKRASKKAPDPQSTQNLHKVTKS